MFQKFIYGAATATRFTRFYFYTTFQLKIKAWRFCAGPLQYDVF